MHRNTKEMLREIEYVRFIDIFIVKKLQNVVTIIDVTFDLEGFGRRNFWSGDVYSFSKENAKHVRGISERCGDSRHPTACLTPFGVLGGVCNRRSSLHFMIINAC